MWDAEWKIYEVQGVATLSKHGIIYGNHFREGPIPLQITPHVSFVRHHLGMLYGNSEEWLNYTKSQYGLSEQETQAKEARFRKLIDDLSPAQTAIAVAVRLDADQLVIVDGFHRAAVAFATNKIQDLQLHIVAKGGQLVSKNNDGVGRYSSLG